MDHLGGRIVWSRRSKIPPLITVLVSGELIRKAGEMYQVDLYRKVRLACHHEGLSKREAARRFGVDRKTVDKILRHSVPPGYRRSQPVRRPKLGP